MTRLSTARLAGHLGRLDGPRLAAFVADLWAARGYETAVEDAVVIATRGGETTVIHPVPRLRFRGVPDPGRDVDVVVAPGAGIRPRRFAARADARLLTTADVRELLVFAIDFADCVDLCERYFGATPAALRASPTRRVAATLRSLGAAELPAPVVAVAVILVVLAGAAGIAITATGPRPAADPVGVTTPSGTPDVEPLVAAATPVAVENDDAVHFPIEPPGVSRDGVTNRTALAVAHDRGLRDRAYTIWIDLYRPRDGVVNATRVQRDIDVTVQGDRYRVTTTIVGSSSRVRERVLDLYHDGSSRYVAERRGEVVDYRSLRPDESPTVLPEPPALRRTLVDTYLSTPQTRLTGIETRERRTYYRVVGEGPPAGLPNVEEYRVEAMVDTEGVVRELTAEYVVTTPAGRYPVRLTMTVDDLFWTTVEPPSWYAPRFGANATQGGH